MTNDRTTDTGRDTGPLTPVPLPIPVDDPPANQRSQRTWLIVAGAGGLLLLLAAVGWLLFGPNPMNDQRPVAVVQSFAAAIESRDVSRMLQHLEPTIYRREISPELRSYIEYVEEFQLNNPTYTLLSNDGTQAEVRWTGTLRYRVNLGTVVHDGERPIDTTVALRRYGNDWYIQSVNLPNE
jgi:hypothetical protein